MADQSEMRRDMLPGLLRSVAYNRDHGVTNVHVLAFCAKDLISSLTINSSKILFSAAKDINFSIGVEKQGKLKGQVRFENLAAGLYKVDISGDGIKPYSSTVEVPACVDLKERIVTVEEMEFIFDFNSELLMKADSASIKAGEYDIALHNVKNNKYMNNELTIVSNFPGDEKEFYYMSTLIGGGIAITNPSETTAIYGVHAEIDETQSGLPCGTFMLSSGNVRSGMREVGTLNPKDIRDITWVADTSNFYYHAEFSEIDSNFYIHIIERSLNLI